MEDDSLPSEDYGKIAEPQFQKSKSLDSASPVVAGGGILSKYKKSGLLMKPRRSYNSNSPHSLNSRNLELTEMFDIKEEDVNTMDPDEPLPENSPSPKSDQFRFRSLSADSPSPPATHTHEFKFKARYIVRGYCTKY